MRFWVPYETLPDAVKELSREWARRALEVVRGHLGV
jgi:hypothetical protein